ncbi:Isoquinoline 1-oxidoreductase subunit [Duganella callida]|uniref:Isoquinoline 1-oxidoreductase subunit n=1 Tax=Duganella callida TaxID=2561932 RepID=A0A4Y9SVY5_9BURK|nr:Isoquinoline 1-oxidoreductase subunit [Duganella callida]TFW29374.1 Isoquinoline 1-oxidoreductase subunit [Duganella callida]
MRARGCWLALAWLVTGPLQAASGAEQVSAAAPLKAPAEFQNIQDKNARSVALFVEAGKVINSPRCMNCHPALRAPTQGDDRHPHVPPIAAGESGMGKPGLFCMACHQTRTVALSGTAFPSIPGHEHWMLAPESMAWQGKTLGQICEQIKDTKRNGGRDLKQITEHMGKDTLVGWAWHPGPGRTPAPGTQEVFGQLIQAWIDNGAQCPR